MMKVKNDFFIFRLYLIASAVIIGMAIVVGARMLSDAIFMGQMLSGRQIALSIEHFSHRVAPQSQKEMPEPGAKIVNGVTPGAGPIKGNVNAKVLMVEFSDINCPFCRKFHNEILPLIDKEFIQTGKVRFSYRSFFSHPSPMSRDAALAVICSQSQGKYGQMLDLLNSAPSLDKAGIEKSAQSLGMDLKKFQACLGNKAALDLLSADIKAASSLGVHGTPTIFINGRMVEGAYSYEDFKRIIEEELSRK